MTDAEAEAPILWPPGAKSLLVGKDPVAGKIEGRRRRGRQRIRRLDGIHQHNGCEFEQTLGDGEGRQSLVCCSPWGDKESDMTE